VFHANEHFIPVKYDLSDLISKVEEVLGRFKAGDTQTLRDMATKAGAKAVDMFNILGQLDALVYAALQVGHAAANSWEREREGDNPLNHPILIWSLGT
jgi:3-oxoacyl-[acyl-carrier-protein] synthase III